MIHLTRDEITTMCNIDIGLSGGWSHDVEAVECIECLRREILRQMAKNRKCHSMLTTAARQKIAAAKGESDGA